MNCKVCGNGSANKIYDIKERIINRGDVFKYLYCPCCGTLSRISTIEDMSFFYGNDYYAYKDLYHDHILKRVIKKIFANIMIQTPLPESLQVKYIQPLFPSMSCLCGIKLDKSAVILDIGGGSGLWLKKLRDYGYHNLTNVDLYAPCEKYDGVTYIRSEVTDIPCDNKYDLITMHHSFEHMDDPDEVLQHIGKLLRKNGLLLIRMPVMENMAWKKYKANWYQIDAPRHSFLYTERAVEILCDRNGFYIEKIIYDSTDTYMQLSKMYAETAFSLDECLSRLKIGRNEKKYAQKMNLLHKGDMACFYIKASRI